MTDAPLRLAPGLHRGVPEAVYHADPAETPSASSSALRTLLSRSPEHAWFGHPRLNPAWEEADSTDAKDRGKILHAMVLQTPDPFRVLDVPNYTTKAAKDLKAATIKAGLIPVKIDAIEELRDVASAVRERMRNMPEVWKAIRASIAEGLNEATLIGWERGVLCRVRYDMLPPKGFPASFDLKFTGMSAEPEAFGKKVLIDYSMQAALYPRIVRTVRGDAPLFVMLAAETEPPYAISLHALDPEARAMADEKLDYALNLWRNCLRRGDWAGYSSLIHYHGPKPWEFRAWEERRALDAAHDAEMAAEDARELAAVGASS